jgi:hypothetical protein
MTLPDGLYDLLITEGVAAQIDMSRAEVDPIKGGVTEFLADAISRQMASILDEVEGDDSERPKRQLELVNELLVTMRRQLAAANTTGQSAEQIKSIFL